MISINYIHNELENKIKNRIKSLDYLDNNDIMDRAAYYIRIEELEWCLDEIKKLSEAQGENDDL